MVKSREISRDVIWVAQTSMTFFFSKKNIDYSRCFVYQKLNRIETFSLFVLDGVINRYPVNNGRCWIQIFQKDDDSRMFLTWRSVNGKISKNVLRFSSHHVSYFKLKSPFTLNNHHYATIVPCLLPRIIFLSKGLPQCQRAQNQEKS